ncbi:hypothetical protein B0H15DRAFT_21997 [Mycena belliarum]|uniref:C2H2-type domain-containing protein n=1 Tax=Mycena belliarum TaxID=1033014 RepID=A0AAD6UKU0_9AGAR|nr:hypothetical protein B0H15DRAFT_21997 [Mycena belliae]
MHAMKIELTDDLSPPVQLPPYDGPIAPLSTAARSLVRPSIQSVPRNSTSRVIPSEAQSSSLPTTTAEPTQNASGDRVDDFLPTSSQAETKSKKYSCDVCGKYFDRPSGLQTHMNIHTKSKPYACGFPDCAALFNTNSNAKRHQRSHGDENAKTEPPPTVYPGPVQFALPTVFPS